jgi:hypothetical protein
MIYDFLENKGVQDSVVNRKLIDIGSGDGKHGAEFEAHGYEVTYLEKKNGQDAITYDYPKDTYGIAVARNSLPFMGENQFQVMMKIYDTLKVGGYFYGTVFGDKEPWAREGKITALEFSRVEKFLESLGFQILWKSTEEGIGKAFFDGQIKNWHIFKFLCKKQ